MITLHAARDRFDPDESDGSLFTGPGIPEKNGTPIPWGPGTSSSAHFYRYVSNGVPKIHGHFSGCGPRGIFLKSNSLRPVKGSPAVTIWLSHFKCDRKFVTTDSAFFSQAKSGRNFSGRSAKGFPAPPVQTPRTHPEEKDEARQGKNGTCRPASCQLSSCRNTSTLTIRQSQVNFMR